MHCIACRHASFLLGGANGRRRLRRAGMWRAPAEFQLVAYWVEASRATCQGREVP
jgi:hypothetical protein